MKLSHFLLPFAILATPLSAATQQDEQFWFNGTVMGSLKGDLLYFAEVQPRFGDGLSRLDQLLLRPAIGWKVSDAVSTYLGYAHVVLPIDNGRDRNEERIFLQLSWTLGDLASGTLSSRSRLERRRLSDGDDTGWRARQMLRFVRPLTDPQRTRALVSVEGFAAFDDTDWGARSGFDQLRSFVGVEVPLKGKSTIEVGYLNQLVNRTAGDLRVNHVASLSLFIRP
jgi:hypothetical protein